MIQDLMIREADYSDSANLSHLDRICSKEDGASAYTRKEFDDFFDDDYTVYVAEMNDEFLGMIIFQETRKELRITHVCVRPDYRREGIGLSMMANVNHHSISEKISAVINKECKVLASFFASCGMRLISQSQMFWLYTREAKSKPKPLSLENRIKAFL